jgi:hypothetical protein
VSAISPELRRELLELWRDGDRADRHRARRRGELAPDWPTDEWLREIAILSQRTCTSVYAVYDFLVAQLRPGEGQNLLSIRLATLDVLDDVLSRADG